MSKRRVRRKKKKKVERPKTPPPVVVEESEEEEEEGEEIEEEVLIPRVWRLADLNDSYGVLKLIQEAEVAEKTKKKSGEEDGEDEEEEEEEEEVDEEDGEVEYDENGEPIIRKLKKVESKEPEEPYMSLNELLNTTHPEHEYNLFHWAIISHHTHVIRKLISFKEAEPKIFGFSNPKIIKIVKSWTHELDTLNKLELENAKKIQQEHDSEGEESENEEEGEERPDFFETTSQEERMSVPELQSLCKLGLYEGEGAETYLKIRNGFGRALYPNGDIYLGTFQDHLKDGYGVYLYERGGFYIGHFHGNLRDGFDGYMNYPDGSVYQGSFCEDLRKGYGRFRYFKGDFYYGQWSEDKKEGYGVYEFHKDGSFFDGNWKNGKFVSGLWQMKNGMVYSGEYESGTGRPFGMGVFYRPKKGVKQVGEYNKNNNGNGDYIWKVFSNENMTQKDFGFLRAKKRDRTIICIVTGRSEVGKERLLQGLEKVMKRHPSLFFLRRMTDKPTFGSLSKYSKTIDSIVFEDIKEKGGFYYDWEDDDGFKIGLPVETMKDLGKLRGTKIVFLKVERLTKEFIERLKIDFVRKDDREVRELKIMKVVCEEEVIKRRLKKRNLEDEEISKIIEENRKKDEIEKQEGITDEIIILQNNKSISKSVNNFANVISMFDKQ